MSWRTDLLDPIPGDNPCGADLRYEAVYDDIKEARREDIDAPQGAWAAERKVADWPLVAKLCGDLLAKKTKDLQIAVWYIEANIRLEGLPPLRSGLEYLSKLIETYWDNLYPALEDGDAELRAAPLEWLGSKLDFAIKSIPINPAGHTFLQQIDCRAIPTEEAAKKDSKKATDRKKALDAGKLAPEDYDKAVEQAPKAFYKQLIGDIDASLNLLKSLGKLCDEKFGDASPSFGGLRKSLEEIRMVVHPILKKKLELDPDPPEAEPVPETASDAPSTPEPAAGGEDAAESGALTPEPTSRNDAVSRVAAAAKYLRKTEPSNPAAYLMMRGLRWGELRSNGLQPKARTLEAPTTLLRTQLKSLLLDQRWPELFEAAEAAMAQGCARGWLDLQRYAITACDHLGEPYRLVGAALRAALLEMLRAVPGLPSMTMMDDTPTANAETQAWLKTELELAQNSSPHNGAAVEQEPGMQPPNPFEVALDAVRGGNAERGIQLMMNELARASSPRSRFRRRTELAAVLVAAGREAIAMPILEDLEKQIDANKLEDWESGDVIAQPLVLLYRCRAKANADAAALQALYLRICRLDPLQALQCNAG
jgi:type VI secretion system protein ImpA